MQSGKNLLALLSNATLLLLLLLLSGCNVEITTEEAEEAAEETPPTTLPADTTLKEAVVILYQPLIINLTGPGSGVVTSADNNITCEYICETAIEEGSIVTLTAEASEGSAFIGWSGACDNISTQTTCIVTVNEAKSVSAQFVIPEHSLDIVLTGGGEGIISSTGHNINCDTTCETSIPEGSVVTLTAQNSDGSAFIGWLGACDYIPTETTCIVTVDKAKLVTAQFVILEQLLNINLTGTGEGVVTISDHNINCETTCETSVAEGSIVTLTAQAYEGSVFNGWSGVCENNNTEDTCTTTVDKAVYVSAEFILPAEYMLIVNKSGTGSGAVESAPEGILCGDECSYIYDSGTTIILVPKPTNGSQFWGWSGACSGTGVCKVTLNNQEEVNAEFGIPVDIAAFPGAEGFGALTSGGRGGDVVYVTNLNASGPGSLNQAFGYDNGEMNKPRYILFKVSGIVDSAVFGSPEWHNMTHVQYGNFTYAGHSSPGGIIVQGISDSCENGVECEHNNMIFRHLKSRPDGKGQDDALRLTDSRNVIIDHASLARATDEVMQIGTNSNFTIQNSILAETTGEHYDRGGILIKYSTEDYPNTDISFHHNMFHRIGGRLPQIDCSDIVEDMCEAPNEMNLEVSYNLIWDPATFQLLKSDYLKPWGQKFGLTFNINFINNYMFARSTFKNPMFASTYRENDELFYSGNKMNLYPEYQDLELMFCCNNFFEVFPNTKDFSAGKISTAHDFPELTYTGSGDEILSYMIDQVGAFPRDPMDRRYINSLINKVIDPTDWSERPVDDAHLFDWATPPPPPLDSDDDGMPDEWEICNGLDPFEQDHNNKQLSKQYTGVEGYDNLEVYLNRLSDYLVDETSLTAASCVAQVFQVDANLSSTELTLSEKDTVTLTISSSSSLSQVLINTDQVIDPFSWPSPLPIDITSSGEGNSYSSEITIPESRDPGNYQISIRAINKSGDISDLIVELKIL